MTQSYARLNPIKIVKTRGDQKAPVYKKTGQETRRYRLVEERRIKGFMTQNAQEKLYSTNGDQWHRDSIAFDHAQHWTGQKDRYGNMILGRSGHI